VINKSYRTTTIHKKGKRIVRRAGFNLPPLSPLFLFHCFFSCSDFDTTISTWFPYSYAYKPVEGSTLFFSSSNQSSKFITGILKMGSKNGKPVLREEDLEDLARSSGLAPQEVVSYIF
jgi:hypothetical protein